MALRADSYSSVANVAAFTRRLLDGQATYTALTTPALAEVESILDRASGVLNLSLAQAGFAVPVVNSTAKLSCDDWVTAQAVKLVEMTMAAAGESGEENTRERAFAGLYGSADRFVKANALGFKRLGCTVSHKASEGLKFTGEMADTDRTDPDDNSLKQPRFTMAQWEND